MQEIVLAALSVVSSLLIVFGLVLIGKKDSITFTITHFYHTRHNLTSIGEISD